MKSYKESLRYLFSLQGRGMKLGLSNIRMLLREVGNPQKQLRAIHVAGTNGKGSTCSFLASSLTEAGFRTGLYTSPHAVRFTERIRIGGEEIPEKVVADYARLLRPAIEQTRATFFEATTCIAFLYFADRGVDMAVIETGLGGRLDATNLLDPLISVITSVGLDHTHILGGTHAKIAREKGGIIKPLTPCVVRVEDQKALQVLKEIAERKRAPLFRPDDLVTVRHGRGRTGRVTMRSRLFALRNLRIGLDGSHQIRNATTALATLEILRRTYGGDLKKVTSRATFRGFQNVVANTGIEGRLQSIRKWRILLDVAHNPDGIRSLVEALRERGEQRMAVVFGVMRDKDCGTMVSLLSGVAEVFVTVAPAQERALPERELRFLIRNAGHAVRRGGTVRSGLRVARRITGTQRRILVTGSHYVVGEALQGIRTKGGLQV